VSSVPFAGRRSCGGRRLSGLACWCRPERGEIACPLIQLCVNGR
jgi:hypothetical protein